MRKGFVLAVLLAALSILIDAQQPQSVDTKHKIETTSTAADSAKIAGGLTAGTGVVGIIDTTGKIPAISSTYFTTPMVNPLYGGAGIDLSGVLKGSLVVGSALGTFATKTVGANGTVLTANSAVAGGVEWAASGGGSPDPPQTGSGTIDADDEVVVLDALAAESVVTVELDASALTAGNLYPEVSSDGTNFTITFACRHVQTTDGGSSSVASDLAFGAYFESSNLYVCNVAGMIAFRVRGDNGIAGSADVSLRSTSGINNTNVTNFPSVQTVSWTSAKPVEINGGVAFRTSTSDSNTWDNTSPINSELSVDITGGGTFLFTGTQTTSGGTVTFRCGNIDGTTSNIRVLKFDSVTNNFQMGTTYALATPPNPATVMGSCPGWTTATAVLTSVIAVGSSSVRLEASTTPTTMIQPIIPISATGTIGVNLATNNGVDIGNVDVSTVGTITPGGGSANLGKLEDSVSSANHTGVSVFGVRNDGGSTQTTTTTGNYASMSLDAYGAVWQRADHPNRFQCAMTSTATTSTVVTGCTAPGAGLSRYITDISYNSSIISTTANFMTLQYGTGANCGTGTTVVWRMANSPAFAPVIQSFTTPIKLGANTDLCFLHPGAGTRLINIQGYIAP
jgi:hypothetical protein